MRRLRLILLAFLLLSWLPLKGHAQTANVTFETVTFAAVSIGFTSTTLTPDGSPPITWCQGKVETAQLRYRYDGTAPTSSVGAVADINDILTISGRAYLLAFRGIRTGGSSAVVNFHCTSLR